MTEYDIIRNHFISEFEKDLENNGVDTACFMGYGYGINDIKVGAEFYFSYLYHGRRASLRNSTVEEVLRSCKLHAKDNGIDNFFDVYKIIQKYKYFDSNYIDFDNRSVIPLKQRREHVVIKNLRTGETSVLHPNDVNYAHLFCWRTVDNYDLI